MLNNKALAASLSAGPKTYVEDVFSTYLYTGNGSTQTIVNGIDLTGKGGLTWVKSRSNPTSHILVDTARGNNKGLLTNANIAEQDFAGSENQISLNSNGFTVTTSGPGGSVNVNGQTYTSWTFRKAAKFFDVVTWTGNGVIGRTISHSLGSVPGTIIIKRTNAAANWVVYHRSLGNEAYLLLNNTDPAVTGANIWNSTTPTNTEFTISNAALVNGNGDSYVAYLFAHDAGGFGDSGNDSVISCGSMTNAAPVNLGWEPQFVLLKRTNSTGSWFLLDTLRGFDSSTNSAALFADLTDSEAPSGFGWSLNATGFSGAAAGTYIYIAIRRGPMKTPTDATKVFAATSTATASSPGATATTGFPVDLSLYALRNLAGLNSIFFDRLRGTSTTSSARLISSSSAAEATSASNGIGIQSNTTVTENWTGGTGYTNILWNFRRAPGFFDVVAYTGTGSARTVAHNLGVAPELMIIKSRSTARNWQVYFGNNLAGLILNSTLFAQNTPDYWNDTSPTAAVFTVGQGLNVNESGAGYTAYLFATCPGVSKVGSYTGTGNSTFNVNCGFTTGARFVLIKRTDSSGDWYVWDSARGLTVSSAPYLLLNSTATEVTGTTYINSISTGFGVSAGSPEIPVNITGASYIYLAIA